MVLSSLKVTELRNPLLDLKIVKLQRMSVDLPTIQ